MAIRNGAKLNLPHDPVEHQRLAVNASSKVVSEVTIRVCLMACVDEATSGKRSEGQWSRCISRASELHSSPFHI